MKVLPVALTLSPKAVQELKKELQIARRLSPPHIVRFHNIDQWEGVNFILMEYVAVEGIIEGFVTAPCDFWGLGGVIIRRNERGLWSSADHTSTK